MVDMETSQMWQLSVQIGIGTHAAKHFVKNSVQRFVYLPAYKQFMSFKALEDSSWGKEPAASYWLLPVSGAPVSKGTFLPFFWIISIQVQQVPRYWEAIAEQLDDIQADSERTLYEFQRALDHVCHGLHEKCSWGHHVYIFSRCLYWSIALSLCC